MNMCLEIAGRDAAGKLLIWAKLAPLWLAPVNCHAEIFDMAAQVYLIGVCKFYI